MDRFYFDTIPNSTSKKDKIETSIRPTTSSKSVFTKAGVAGTLALDAFYTIGGTGRMALACMSRELLSRASKRRPSGVGTELNMQIAKCFRSPSTTSERT